MVAYVCVYRWHLPAKKDFEATKDAADRDRALKKFLDGYEASYYDWGDDPSFFAATEMLGDVRRASWGVCRRDVRSRLDRGDFVVFFCAKLYADGKGLCDYFYIGVGTVAEAVDRRELFRGRRLSDYHRFYNVLAVPDGQDFQQREIFRPFHANWRERLTPYIIFDPKLTFFNLDRPLWVARYEGALPEHWRSRQSRAVARLEALLFSQRGVLRRLKTSQTGYSHPPLNLSRPLPPLGLVGLRRELIRIARTGAA